MIDRAPLADVLTRFKEDKGYSLSRLAAEIGVSKSTLHRWIHDESKRPQTWQPLLKIAATLGLDRTEANELLAAARHPPIEELVERPWPAEDESLLSRWTVTGLDNLPGSLTSFVGREGELGELAALLARHRLITLTGPGGSGKTRLAQKVAESLAHTFADGVYYVGLAPITDPALVIPAIARALDIREASGGESPRERLARHLRGRRPLLLLLDNFEQVADAAPEIGGLLSATRTLQVLVTSRTRLDLRGEQLFPVEPLPLPARTSDLAALARNPAVTLFAERARLADRRFALTAGNVLAVAEICRRVDGLPLAIELAAARARHFPAQQLLERFPTGLGMASGGPRDAPARQQTLRATIAWSHGLLEPQAQRLFRRLAVFAGGCPEDAAMEVLNLPGDEELDVSAGLDSLVESNLLRHISGVDGERRFGMLGTIREYALECLESSGELQAASRAHAGYYLKLAETAEPEWDGPRQTYWLDRLELERDNLRAALRWCEERGEVVTGLRLSTALMSLWQLRDYHVEGRGWLESFTTADCEVPPGLRAKALLWRGLLLMRYAGDLAAADPLFGRALALYRELDDPGRASETLQAQGDLALNRGQVPTARGRFTESLGLAQQAGDSYLTARAHRKIAVCAQEDEDYDTAQHHWERSLEYAREAGTRARIAQALNGLGEVARHRRDLEGAQRYYQQSLALGQEIESEWTVAMSLHNLGYIAAYRGEHEQAIELFTESLSLHEKRRYKKGVAECLAGLAHTAALQGRLERSARLCGAAEALLGSIGSPLEPADQADFERTLGIVRSELADERCEALLAEGGAISLEQAIEYARKDCTLL